MKARWFGTLVVLTIWTWVFGHAQGPKPAMYSVTDLGTLGGTYSVSYTINDGGLVTGGAATANQTNGVSQTAFAWSHGQITNLGTLGGAACSDCSSEGAGSNASGTAAILSETADFDPNGEDFCGFGTHHQCLAAVYKNGALTPLRPLDGGNNSQAYWINKSGDVAGFSETGVYDGNCAIAYQLYRFSAVKWGANGKPQPLRPWQDDTVSFALGMNEKGEAVGVSGLCSNTTVPPNNVPSGPHAVLWEKDGTPVLVPSLQGALDNNVASSINDRGDVGGTQLISDGTIHGFVWNRATGIRDLAFPGAFVTVVPCCRAINNKGEITGFAFDENGPQTFVWKNGSFTDLNAVLAADAPWYIANTASINEAGQIAATGVNINTGEMHAVLLTPISPEGAPGGRGKTKVPVLPERVRMKFPAKH
jgi:probable HAF family extracellular repeat protein